jgi:hypothetical protein
LKPFVVAFAVLVFWVAITILLCWRTTRRGESDMSHPSVSQNEARKTGIRLTTSAFAVALTLTLLPPIFKADTIAAEKWAHHAGVVVLGGFLAAALYFQLELRMKISRKYSLASIRRTYQRWLELTELLPAPASVTILVSGFGLVYSNPRYSINRGWIFGLILALAKMMADGIFGYTHDLRRLAQAADVAIEAHWTAAQFVGSTRNRARDIRLLVHSLSFPIVVALPISRVCDDRSPITSVLDRAGIHDRTGWMRLWPSLVLFVTAFLAMATLNRFGRRRTIDKVR